MTVDIQYDVALSFAGEDREFVEQVARHLQANGLRVFYDSDQQVELWGKNLLDYLDEVYRMRSQCVVMFISKHYASKVWPNHERQSAMARALEEKYEYVLPAKFDSTELPGLQPTIQYVDLNKQTEESFAQMILQKVARLEEPEQEGATQTDVVEVRTEDKNQYELELKRLAEVGPKLDTIRQVPHWEFVIRPFTFKAERINSLPGCLEVVNSCHVARINWEFPHVRDTKKSTGNDWIDSETQFIGHQEYWRLYQSGQFVFHSMFREMFYEEVVKQRANFQVVLPDGFVPGGYHDIVIMLRTITELCEFAANYARHGLVDSGLSVGVFMQHVKDDILFCWESGRHWSSFRSTADNQLGKFWHFPKGDLLERTHPIALDITNYFWHRFGWFDAPLKELVKEQSYK